MERIQRSCVKNWGEFDDHAKRSFRFSSHDLLSWLVSAALCSHTGKSMFQAVHIAQASLALLMARNTVKSVFYSLINHLWPDMHWCTDSDIQIFRNSDISENQFVFWLCELGEQLVLDSVNKCTGRRITVNSYDCDSGNCPVILKMKDGRKVKRHSPHSDASRLFSTGQFIYGCWSLFRGQIFYKLWNFLFIHGLYSLAKLKVGTCNITSINLKTIFRSL